MMTKLRAEHSSEAVRIWLEADIEPTVSLSLEDRRSEEDRALATTPDFVRMIRQRMPDVVEEFDGDEDSVEETRASRRARSR